LIFWPDSGQPGGQPFLFVYPMSNFSISGENRGQKSKYLNGGASQLVARDPIEVECEGGWSQEQRERMDAAFCAVLELAFQQGLERRASAAATVAVSEGSLVVACYRRMAWRRAAAGAPVGGMSSLALV